VSSVRHAKLRFGSFELDIRLAELRNGGTRVRLPEQPFRILLMLLERQGDLVSRDEIRDRLWPDATVVEFDHSINAAVKRLRNTLCDSADQPRYIETVPRRGYRFIAPVDTPAPPVIEVRKPSSLYEPEPAGGIRGRVAQRSSIAVLPFTNMSGDPDNEYFSDGLAEELINELAHVPGLKVVARTSAFAFKGRQEDIRTIAHALGVANIVEGSVRRAGRCLRVSAQLIAADDGTHLWSERYDREMADIFAVQDEIARAIATALRVQLAGTLKRYVPRLAAYEVYLKARHCLAAFTRESLPRSRDLFEEAVALDADFAAAHSGLAMALVSLTLPGIIAAPAAMPLARAAATRALGIEPASQDAEAVLGIVAALHDFDWNEAERRFHVAIAREPVAPYVHWYYSFSYLLPMGRSRESVYECMLGMEDDPLNFMGGFHYAGALLAAGNAQAGEAYLRQLSELHLSLYQPYYLLALSQAVRGLHKEGLAAAEKAYSMAPWSTTTKGLFGGLLRCAGETNRANELYSELAAGDQYGVATGLSLYHVSCSEIEHAAEWAVRAVEQRDTRMILLIALLRAFRPDILRSNVRWSAIAHTLGIPPALPLD
jgi:TolB-like protein